MKYVKIIISVMLSVTIFFSETAFQVHAEEKANTEVVQEVSEPVALAEEALSLSVTYPDDIKCGNPVTFTMNAAGGSGNYQYRIGGLMVNDGSELVSVYDISYGSNGSYKESNEFTFTFYASGTYYIRFSVIDMATYQTVNSGLYDYRIVIQDENYPSVEQIVNTVAAQCEAACSTDFEKALWLHDWIIDHADYDYSYSYCSAEGVLARGKGTCESYHRAYVMLLNRVGIQTGRITGNGHVWTAVKMDGEWYQIDSTWDDMGADFKDTYYEHMYFGLTDYIIGLVHTDHSGAVAGYESTALENNYFIKTGEIKQWSDPFIDAIRQNIADGKEEFTLPVTSNMPNSYKDVIYNLVAYQLSQEDWNNIELSVSYADTQLTCKVVKTGIDTDEKEDQTQAVYQGVDYAAVYDFDYYMNTYSDLKAAYGNDEAGALAHFVNYGMAEGRQGNAEFNVYTYRNRYADLRIGYRGDLKGYYLHYINNGKAEGRSGAGMAEFVPITVYQDVDYASVYDYAYYMNKYPDLASVYGNDDYGALQHFVEHGMSEGLQGSEEFNVYTYKNRYIDLRRGFKDNLPGYYLHYINNGKAEGRSGAGDAVFVGETIYQGVDYAAVYNYDYYMNKYPDLASAFGNDEYGALQHFVEHGMSEGRQGSSEFDVYAYMSRYPDLKAGFGDYLLGYYLHYINNGKAEGRSGTSLTEEELNQGKYNEADYAAVYDFDTYVSLYPDIATGFKMDRAATLEHFVEHGMSEGRQGSEEFNVYAYMNRYPDLKAGFGDNLLGYYLHYINNGKAEGRSGRVEEVMSLQLEMALESEAEPESENVSEVTSEGEAVSESENVSGDGGTLESEGALEDGGALEGESVPKGEAAPESETAPEDGTALESETMPQGEAALEGEEETQTVPAVENESKVETESNR